MIQRKLAPEALSQPNSTTVIKCNGSSMRPIMAPGDALHLMNVESNKLRAGDAVFCRINGALQVHKLQAINGQRYCIANNKGHVNGWVGAKAIYGLLVQVNDKVIVSQQELNER